MTKFVIHGGVTERETVENDNFFSEMTSELKGDATILCVYFARSKDDWDRAYEEDQGKFIKSAPNLRLRFNRADSNILIFKDQIKKADVVYMRGGTTTLLLSVLKTVPNFATLISGKVVGGSSAGACALSYYYCSCSNFRPISKGLGILKIKTIVHYDLERRDVLNEMTGHEGCDFPIQKLKEEHFCVIKQ